MDAQEAPAPRRVIVIGAGIVGVCTALRLQQDGHSVTVIDPKPPGRGTSFGNAGSISVGSVYPVSTPGVWKRVPAMLMDPASPLSLRWSYMPRMAPWLLRFLAAGRPGRIEQISTALRALSKEAAAAHGRLMAAHRIDGITRPVGWLKAYRTDLAFERTRHEREVLERRGVRFEVLNQDELRQLEPGLARDFRHGFFQPDNVFVTSPIGLTEAYAAAFTAMGGRFLPETVTGFAFADRGPARAVTDFGFHDADLFVIAAGARSGALVRMLGGKVQLDTERGYHLNILREGGPELRRPTVVGEHNFVLAPMREGIRLTTGAEFAGLDAPPDFRRIRRMLPLARAALPGLGGEVTREWLGFRPSTPDSLPVIGRAPGFANVFYGFGHGHIGLTLSARTAELLTDLIAGREPGIDLHPYRADRF